MIRERVPPGSRERKSRGSLLAVGGSRIAMRVRLLPSRSFGSQTRGAAIARDLRTGVGTVLRIESEFGGRIHRWLRAAEAGGFGGPARPTCSKATVAAPPMRLRFDR